MTGVVILTAEEARKHAQGSPPPVPTPWCLCPIDQPCECGNEAPVMPSTSAAGWAVAR